MRNVISVGADGSGEGEMAGVGIWRGESGLAAMSLSGFGCFRALGGTCLFRNVGKSCAVVAQLLIFLVPMGGNFHEGVAWAEGLAAAKVGMRECPSIPLSGEVEAGREWSAPIGQGWVFRLIPIAPSGKGYTGWDMVIDPLSEEGYPDALLLGTPPYESLNEREIGTTFGLRAQDAVAWGPRRFHFLAREQDLKRGRELYRRLMQGDRGAGKPERNQAGAELLSMAGKSGGLGSGEFTVLDAKLTAGAADPAAFARQWAMHLGRVQHTLVQSEGSASERGELRWIRFAVVLKMPMGWKTPKVDSPKVANCTE